MVQQYGYCSFKLGEFYFYTCLGVLDYNAKDAKVKKKKFTEMEGKSNKINNSKGCNF